MQPPEARVRVLDASRLDGDDWRAPRVLHVDAGVLPVSARVAVVVPESVFATSGKTSSRHCPPRFAAPAPPGGTRIAAVASPARSGKRNPRARNPGCRPEASQHVVTGSSSGFALEGRDASRRL